MTTYCCSVPTWERATGERPVATTRSTSGRSATPSSSIRSSRSAPAPCYPEGSAVQQHPAQNGTFRSLGLPRRHDEIINRHELIHRRAVLHVGRDQELLELDGRTPAHSL